MADKPTKKSKRVSMKGMGADAFFGPPAEAEEVEQQSAETAKTQTGITVEPNSVIPESPQNVEIGKPQTGITGERDSGITESRQSAETEELQNVIKANTIDGIAGEHHSGRMVEAQNVTTGKHDNVEAEYLQPVKEVERESVIPSSPQSGKPAKTNSAKAGKRKNGKTQEPQSIITDTDEDKPTEKITLYLSWKQLDKLDQMALEYKRRTRQRTDHNKLMRMMVDKFSLDDLI